MEASVAQADRVWAGLVIDEPGRDGDERDLREILGSNAAVIVVRGSEAVIDSVRRIVQARCSCILTRMNPCDADSRAPLLNVASALSSLRRIVVLHNTDSGPTPSILQRGVLMLRDCPEVRQSLTLLVAREMAGYTKQAHSAGTSAHVRPPRNRAGVRAKGTLRTSASKPEATASQPGADEPQSHSQSVST